MKPSTSIALAIIGIVATFVATFSGVYLAAKLQNDQREQQSFRAYKSMISIMDKDCKQTLEMSKGSLDALLEGFTPTPGVMLSSFLSNALLLAWMDEKRSVRLISAIGDAANFSAIYTRKIAKLDMIPDIPGQIDIVPKKTLNLQDQQPPFPMPNQMAIQQAMIIKEREILKNSAREILKTYVNKLNDVCIILEEERDHISSL